MSGREESAVAIWSQKDENDTLDSSSYKKRTSEDLISSFMIELRQDEEKL
jgi:hypothetical protein